jgi:hypothetical protein
MGYNKTAASNSTHRCMCRRFDNCKVRFEPSSSLPSMYYQDYRPGNSAYMCTTPSPRRIVYNNSGPGSRLELRPSWLDPGWRQGGLRAGLFSLRSITAWTTTLSLGNPPSPGSIDYIRSSGGLLGMLRDYHYFVSRVNSLIHSSALSSRHAKGRASDPPLQRRSRS